MQYINGRQIGRRGSRVGLPARFAGAASGRVLSSSGPRDLGRPMDGGGSYRSSENRPPPIGIEALMAHMRPEAQPYRVDAYEDSPQIKHSAPPRRRLSRGSVFGLMVGSVVSLLIIFVAGFLSAVMIFGEPSEGGDVTIRTAPSLEDRLSEQSVLGGETIVSPAEAQREVLPPPSPEVVRAEQARDRALNEQSAALDASQIAAPQASAEAGQADPTAPAAITTATVTDRIIFPADKPVPPGQTAGGTQSPAQTAPSEVLAAPGSNYSLQFGAFRDRDNAEALIREIGAAAQAGIITQTGASGNELFYVRAGAFETRLEALQAVQRLREREGVVTFVHANRISG